MEDLMQSSLENGARPSSFQGRLVTMRPPSRDDYPTFYEWRSDPHSLFLWSVFRRIPTYEEFEEELTSMFRSSTIFVIQDRKSSSAIGFVQAYSMAPVDGYGHVMTFVNPEYRRRGHGAEAVLYFLDYLFCYFNLRKVYADVFEFNENSLRPLLRAGFVEEGRLKEHVFFAGQHWDLVKFALYRDAWEELKARFSRLVFIEQELSEQLSDRRLSTVG